MAKGLEKHRQRIEALNQFGKDLARRCSSSCELCGASGTKLRIHEVPPIPEEPDYDHCIMICETCQEQIEHPKRMDSNHWRCLNSAAWSEVTAVQVMAIHLLKRLEDQDWAKELREQLYISPQAESWLEKM
jgi:protein PhnA